MSVYYTKDHEWIRVSQNVGVIGISSHAATQLGDVVYVEGYNDTFVATIYENSTLNYIPYL